MADLLELIRKRHADVAAGVHHPPEYHWLGVVETDNGLQFFTVFDTKNAGIVHYWGEVGPADWTADVSGNLRYKDPESGYTYTLTEEPYHQEKKE